MPLWKKLIAYVAYALAGLVITLLLMGKNVRSQVYVGDQSLEGMSEQQSQAAVHNNPGAVSVKSAFVVRGISLFSLPAPLALPVFLLTVPLLALVVAHLLLARQVQFGLLLLFGVAGLVAAFFFAYSVPRA